ALCRRHHQEHPSGQPSFYIGNVSTPRSGLVMFGTRRAVALSTTALAPISAHVPGATYLMSAGDSNTSTNGPTFNPYSVIYANTTIPAIVTFKDAAIGGSTLANMVS